MKKILIYNVDEEESDLLKQLCIESELDPIWIKSQKELDALVKDINTNSVIIDGKLPKLQIPQHMKSIAIGDEKISSIHQTMRYRHSAVLIRPFFRTAIAMALQKLIL
ncbi:MAG: hypothetical protein ACOCUV_01745 [bacterium]